MPEFATRGKIFGYRVMTPQFRPPRGIRREAVPGGRWYVRKVMPSQANQGKTWYVWNKGKNTVRPRSKYFDTFSEAIEYAQWRAYKRDVQEERERLLNG